MAEELEKEILKAPTLPNIVQGDGRYLMSLLKSYLETATNQINLANGYTAEELDPSSENAVETPKHFTLTFNRLGGTFSWDHISDVTNLAYYELRTDINVGSRYGLLDRTIDTNSMKMGAYYNDTVYLYAVMKDKQYSNPSKITYTKPRPISPGDIALTKNNEGTLITFLEIPTNCIGANVYVNGDKYTTVDNIYLFKHDSSYRIQMVSVAYYDSFGEGERTAINCEIPDVTGFYVEKNGANLDFYWDAVSIYNVKYVVKVGQTQNWEEGLELFSTKLNKQRYVYPNVGNFYFLIKAVDDHNNYSFHCSWYMLTADKEINKNVILDFDQHDTGYSGSKINMYYDYEKAGLKLEQVAFNGEYLMYAVLPQKIRARNWIDYKLNAVTSNSMRICDMDFPVNSYEAERILVCGIIGDIDGVQVKQQIARYIGTDSKDIFSALVDSTNAANGGVLTENVNVSMDECRYNKGAFITDTTQLSYDVSIPELFSLEFWVKKKALLHDCIILVLRGSHTLYVGYDTNQEAFYLRDDVHPDILTVSIKTLDRDWLFIGISQTIHNRSFFIYGLSYDAIGENFGMVAPCGSFTQLYCYPKE